MPQRTAKLIHEKILEKDRFLLVTHQNPDGDAIGSVNALGEMLESLGKEHTIFCSTSASDQFDFLPHTTDITSDPEIWKKMYDVIIVCDSGDLRYAGVDKLIKYQENPFIINIDHHASNEGFGHLNLVIEAASSTTEILHNYFVLNECEINRTTATALLTGLITDTGNFSNSGTSRQALGIASKLIKHGARLNHIRRHILQDKTLPTFKLWGTVLSRLENKKEFDFVYTYITQKDLVQCGLTEEHLEGIANLMNNLNEGKATFVIKEKQDGRVKVSMRTVRDNIDLSQIAKMFGGGGHKKAAGFDVEGPMDKALDTIWSTIEKSEKVR
ncbi:bifunctional oligoribonuclease/PAP phosphatase NrnA [Candidatus Parcubacteria bacterium]|jgi:bifunctional oligoribonuclease and PAP phosphatase NrnA|nr:bifunctional oligoribonuclease/PAP phosphatase NrnA [Candidatus Parcubacteria bacterium]MBT3948658.1 bifunctional oligoribonuclease/PAP phosphatase NrnA [Candidatus Parcubacteria bacterium]